jgi:hypothetical protein
MKKSHFLLLILSAISTRLSWADGHPPSIGWNGWSVSSNERWSLESGPQPKFPLRYPLTNLFDGDPNTTWVFEDSQRSRAEAIEKRPKEDKHPSLVLVPRKPVVMDGLWLMNG